MILTDFNYEVYIPPILSLEQLDRIKNLSDLIEVIEVTPDAIIIRVLTDEALSRLRVFLDNTNAKNKYIINKV